MGSKDKVRQVQGIRSSGAAGPHKGRNPQEPLTDKEAISEFFDDIGRDFEALRGGRIERSTRMFVSFGHETTAGFLVEALDEAPSDARVTVEHYEGNAREPKETTLTVTWEEGQ